MLMVLVLFVQVEELVMFMVVLVVFLLAYGVCSQGLLYKKREPSFEIVKDIIQFPYWQLYGEIFLEEIQSKHTFHPHCQLLFVL